jgi:hypothetical protein
MAVVVWLGFGLCLDFLCLPLSVASAASSSTACNDVRHLYDKGKYYELFGVQKTATEAQIKKTFKKLAVKCK